MGSLPALIIASYNLIKGVLASPGTGASPVCLGLGVGLAFFFVVEEDPGLAARLEDEGMPRKPSKVPCFELEDDILESDETDGRRRRLGKVNTVRNDRT